MVLSFVYAGHFFGNLPVVRHNFTLLIFGIIAVSLLPMVIGMVKARRSASKATSGARDIAVHDMKEGGRWLLLVGRPSGRSLLRPDPLVACYDDAHPQAATSLAEQGRGDPALWAWGREAKEEIKGSHGLLLRVE